MMTDVEREKLFKNMLEDRDALIVKTFEKFNKISFANSYYGVRKDEEKYNRLRDRCVKLIERYPDVSVCMINGVMGAGSDAHDRIEIMSEERRKVVSFFEKYFVKRRTTGNVSTISSKDIEYYNNIIDFTTKVLQRSEVDRDCVSIYVRARKHKNLL